MFLATGTDSEVARRAGQAVRALGGAGFPAAFAALAWSAFLADQTIVFMGRRGELRPLLAHNVGAGDGYAAALAERYTRLHAGQDPNLPLLAPRPGSPSVVCAVDAGDTPGGEYRRALFAEPALRAKASLISPVGDGVVYVNLYRGLGREPFAPRELDALRAASDFLLSLLERHLATPAAPEGRGLSPALIERALAEACRSARLPRLSQREAETCAHILLGRSNEGVALTLGVSLNSAATYRRRAFVKLGISTQKELFAVVLRYRRELDV